MNLKRSFTLLETIVAIYVLLAGIVGAMNLAQQNIGAITLFRHQLIAASLAQEGIEFVRNRRDSNSLTCYATAMPSGDQSCFAFTSPSPNPNTQNMLGITDAGLNCTNPAIGCRVENPFAASVTFTSCAGAGTCAYLLLDPVGRYQYDTGVPTIFDRTIVVTAVSGVTRDSGLQDWRVTSTVRWREKLVDKQVEVKEVLTPNMSQL